MKICTDQNNKTGKRKKIEMIKASKKCKKCNKAQAHKNSTRKNIGQTLWCCK